jgi:tetratricopeptide (TPR) repeat protein
VKGWLADFWRAAWAFFFWNARKSFFVLRRRRGRCPCHNPSDSGRPLATGCEAVSGWHRPERFTRVCPLLRRNDAGFWVCSVPPEKVRPFWGRAVLHYAAALLVLWLLLAALAYAGLRGIGYQVAYRQLAWPPAWTELPAVRAELFIRQARDHYLAGRVKEAINALSVAYQLDPGNYQAGMMLAQFYRAGSPKQADDLYQRLLVEHPARRTETARAWFQSLLARGRLQDVGELARRQLAAEPEQAAAWTHALFFVTRHLGDEGLLKTVRTDPGPGPRGHRSGSPGA